MIPVIFRLSVFFYFIL